MRCSLLLAVPLAGCGGGGDSVSPPPPAAVSSVSISPGPTITLVAGSTSQLSATARDAQGNTLAGRTITWSSSAQNTATVSASGLVFAVAAGVAQIRATAEGKTGEVTLTVTSPPWTATGSMATGRTLHTATLLANGRVLVVGGQTVGAPFQTFASAELYDPATGTWSASGNLATGRANHVAVRLQNGKVLVAGGNSIEQQTRLSSAELYDPATGAWSATGSMATARDLPTAALLNDGKVLVAGGSGPGTNLNALASAEVYDPATGEWSAAGTMTVARASHSVVLLPNGKVLVAGGATGTFASPQLHSSAELYDPATRTWSGTGGFGTPRGFHKAVLLATGRSLIAGGSNFVSASYGTADVYDAAAGTWTAAGSLATARISHTATLLPNGRVLVVGGGGAAGVLASVEVYDPAAGSWSAAPDLRTGRSNHAAVLLANGKVLVVGGQGAGASTGAEIFDPSIAFP